MLAVGCTGGELNITKVERSHYLGVNPVILDPKTTCQGHRQGLQCLGVSANMLVTGGCDNIVSIWKIQGNQLINRQQHTDHRGPVTGVHVDGFRVVSCSADYSIRTYSWNRPFEGCDGQVLESRYSLLGGSLRGNR
jgi:WD40 repeat protein